MIGRNFIASFASKIWIGLLNLALVPIYLAYMGVEAYGLVGFYVTLQSLVVLLDLGLTATINREMARYSALGGQEQNMRDLARTLEIVYWAIAIVIGVAVVSSASYLASSWLKANALDTRTIHAAIVVIGLTLAAEWPMSFYAGGLLGLERHALYGGVRAAYWSLRGAGAVLVVILVPNPIVPFFVWQLSTSLLAVLTLGVLLQRSLPKAGRRARFRLSSLQSVWRFAASMSLVSMAALAFNQIDKIIVSRAVSLESFAYYSLAWQIVGALYLLYTPVYTTYFPVFTRLATLENPRALRGAYHDACQYMSVLVLPLSVMLAVFPYPVIRLWTQNPTVAAQTAPIVSVVLIGATANVLAYMPNSMQQASGRPQLALWPMLPLLVVMAPFLVVATLRFGIYGAALTWSVTSLVQMVATVWLTHRCVLPGVHRIWMLHDVGRPLLVAILVAAFTKVVVAAVPNPVMAIVAIAGALCLAYAGAAFAAPSARARLTRLLRAATA